MWAEWVFRIGSWTRLVLIFLYFVHWLVQCLCVSNDVLQIRAGAYSIVLLVSFWYWNRKSHISFIFQLLYLLWIFISFFSFFVIRLFNVLFASLSFFVIYCVWFTSFLFRLFLVLLSVYFSYINWFSFTFNIFPIYFLKLCVFMFLPFLAQSYIYLFNQSISYSIVLLFFSILVY